MLELLCTVAGREGKPGGDDSRYAASPASPDMSFERVEQMHRPSLAEESNSRHAHLSRAPGARLDAEPPAAADVHMNANDRLAKALAGVGAAGSLARIRQQSAAVSNGTAHQAAPTKRQRFL